MLQRGLPEEKQNRIIMAYLPVDVLVPFIFVLAIVWGGLEVAGIFKNKGVMAIISVVVAFFAISSSQTLSFLQQFLPLAVIIFILVFILSIIIKPFKTKEGFKIDYTLLAIVGVLVLVFLSTWDFRYFGNLIPGADNADILSGIGIVIFLLIIISAYKQKAG